MSNIINIHSNLASRPKDEKNLLAIATRYGIQKAHIKIDPVTQLHAIIAIHNTRLGPALGGCRCMSYASEHAAFIDAARLAKGMSYKAAIMDLAHGGGKAVLIKPAHIPNREAYFQSFGRLVEELAGRYITAVDMGTSVADMDAIASQTQFVASTSTSKGGFGDPAPYTALGVFKGIQAAVKHKFQRAELQGLRVAIQGVGHVGYELAKLLANHNVSLFVSDVNQEAVRKCTDEFQCQVINLEEIYSAEYDIYAPCALGGTINKQTIEQLHCAIVAGSANNQLLENQYADMLHAKGILYAPDYVINSGGLIQIASNNENEISKRLNYLYDLLLELFKQAQVQNISPATVADRKVEQILYPHTHSKAV